MSRLQLFDEAGTALLDTTQAEAIAHALAPIGATFERWPTRALPQEANDAAILAAYAPEIERLNARGGYQSIDVMRVEPTHPERATLRGKFLSEHTHAEDEVRFFVDGAALFTLRGGGRVYNLTCETGDLISVPAGTRHWFDMGASPRFTVLRLFVNPDGWIARFTGDPIAERFPRHQPAAA